MRAGPAWFDPGPSSGIMINPVRETYRRLSPGPTNGWRSLLFSGRSKFDRISVQQPRPGANDPSNHRSLEIWDAAGSLATR